MRRTIVSERVLIDAGVCVYSDVKGYREIFWAVVLPIGLRT